MQGVFVGAATLDLHYLLPAARSRNSKGPATRFGMYAGGPAANAAVTFAHLGGTARLYAEVGSHHLGWTIAAELASRRVELIDMTPGSQDPPMLSSVFSFDGIGDRMAVSSRYPHEGVAETLPGSLPEGTAVVMVDGFLRGPCRDAVSQAARTGATVVLDGGSWKPGMEDLLALVDVAVCSADFHPPGTADHEAALDYLQDRGIARVAVTRGEAPVLYRDGADHGEIPVDDVPVADTLGAGDVLHGAFCWHLASRRPFVAALTEAAAVATRSCRSFGTRAWMEG